MGRIPNIELVPNSNQLILVSVDGEIALYRHDSLVQLLAWVQENRYLPDLSCTQRRLYDLAPCVDETLPPTATLQATETLLPRTIQPTFTPFASPTPTSPPTATPLPTITNAELGTNTGEIGIGGRDIWAYDGQAGELITIRLEADNPAQLNSSQTYNMDGFDTYLIVRVPDGSVIGEFDDTVYGVNTNASVQDLALPQTGVYEIEVRGLDDLSGGAYTLIIERAP